MGPIFSALRAMGYTEFRAEGILIGGWQVQFLPVSSALDAEALHTAQTIEVTVGGQTFQTRVLLPEYLVVKALQVGRAKDHTRIMQFLEEQAVDMTRLRDIVQRFNLGDTWTAVSRRMGIQQDEGDDR